MGPPDQCQHAASIINDLLQSIRTREDGGQGVSESQQLNVISTILICWRNKFTFGSLPFFFYRDPQVEEEWHLEAEGGVEARATGALQEER